VTHYTSAFRAVTALLLLVCVIRSAAAVPAPPEPVQEWGPADQGVQARLRPTKAAWGLDEVPSFTLDLRNHGDKAARQAPAVLYCEVEFDGVWYVYGEPLAIRMPVRDLQPAAQADNWLTFTLGLPWVRKDCCPKSVRIENPVKLDKVRLHTPPGKHTVRVSFQFPDGPRPVSGPIEFTVLKTDAIRETK
jgi:hypothetical protein